MKLHPYFMYHVIRSSHVRRQREEEEESKERRDHWFEAAEKERERKLQEASKGIAWLESLSPEKAADYRILIVSDETIVPPKGFVKLHTDKNCYFFNVSDIVSIVRCDNSERKDKAVIQCSDCYFTYETNEPYEDVIRLIAEAALETERR